MAPSDEAELINVVATAAAIDDRCGLGIVFVFFQLWRTRRPRGRRPGLACVWCGLPQPSRRVAAGGTLARPSWHVLLACTHTKHLPPLASSCRPSCFRFPRGNGLGLDLAAHGITPDLKGTPLEVGAPSHCSLCSRRAVCLRGTAHLPNRWFDGAPFCCSVHRRLAKRWCGAAAPMLPSWATAIPPTNASRRRRCWRGWVEEQLCSC